MIQLLRGNSSTLNASQQVFAEGQPIFEKDTQKLKIGNGVDTYSALKYIGESNGSASLNIQEYGDHTVCTYDNFVEVCLRYVPISDTISIVGTANDTSGNSWYSVTNGVYYLADRYTNGGSFAYSLPDTIQHCCLGFDAAGITWVDCRMVGDRGNILMLGDLLQSFPVNIVLPSIYWFHSDDYNTPYDPDEFTFILLAKGIRTS